MNHQMASNSSSSTTASTTASASTLNSNWWPISPSHQQHQQQHGGDENVAPQVNHWRSPIKPESKDYIANLPLPPLETMLAAVGDAHVVRLVCKRSLFF
jgi:hypothetical protein